MADCTSVYIYGSIGNRRKTSDRERGGKPLRSRMAGGGAVKLIGGWPSPFAMRPRIALNLKGVEYEFVEEAFGAKSDLLLKSNPVYKKIPVLLHGDRPLCESLVIVEYIDATWGSSKASVFPKDPYDRAIARFWAYYIDDKWFPALMAFAKAQTAEERAACLGQLREATQLLEGAFEKCSQGKRFFGGDGIGYVDIALGCFLGSMKGIQKMAGVKILDQAKTPLLCGWAERFCAEEVVKRVMPETDKLIEFFKMVQARMKAASS